MKLCEDRLSFSRGPSLSSGVAVDPVPVEPMEVVLPAATPIEDKLDHPITRHMRTNPARLTVDQTVGEALAALRAVPPDGRILYFYVVDGDQRLKGVVPTRSLLLSAGGRKVSDLMMKNVVAIPAGATLLEACEYFILHRFLAFPVVDELRRLVGVVDVDLYTNELSGIDKSERSEDLFQLIGVHYFEARRSSPLAAFRRRFPWLMCNIGGGIMAAFLSGLFQAELKEAVALSLFIPVVLALSESVGIQSVSLALQVLHGQRPSMRSILARLAPELMTGLFLGIAAGAAVALVALLWLRQWAVVACVLCGIAGGVTMAAAIGLALPSFLRLLKREPQLAAGPIALAASDMVTLLLYFSLARWWIT